MSRQIIGITMCSGIGAPEVAAPWVDWRLASEIEPFPRAVLQQRFGYKLPEDQNQGEPLLWGDMTEITPELLRERGLPLPDLIVAGTPCQAFSVSGARKGLEDARGNLTLSFVEILHAIAAARPDGKLAALWENVPGVLSDKGNAFGCFLGGIVGAMDAVPRPAGGSWPREGMVEGPRARAAWCVLDSQWFGVAQRRERVFVVVDFGNCLDPAAVLLEPDRLRGDHPPRREAGQGFAQGIEFGPSGGGFTDVKPTLDTRAKDGPVRNQLADAALVPAVSMCLNAGAMGRIDGESETFIPVAFDCKGTEVQFSTDGSHPTLRSMGHDGSHQNGGGHAAICAPLNTQMGLRGADTSNTSREGVGIGEIGEPAFTLQAAHSHGVITPWAVRRLTPTECARLQAFPDYHTRIEWRGKPADQCPDGPQYKALGNSMTTTVIAWIMDRMRISMEEQRAKA